MDYLSVVAILKRGTGSTLVLHDVQHETKLISSERLI
jgi:hypothetical protein